MWCMEKTEGCKADLENEQISATRTPKMEPECSKWLRRKSKKGPRSQQCRHLGNRRHLRRQKRPQRGPMGRPNGAPGGDWRRKGSRHGSNKPPKRCQKNVEIGDPGEVENRLDESSVQHMKGHPKWSLKTGSLMGNTKMTPKRCSKT